MTFYELSIIATLSATFAVMCVYFFLYTLYRQTHIGLWAVFWLLYFVIQIMYRTPLTLSPIFQVILLSISVANHVLLVYATSSFLGRKMSLYWYYLALAVLAVSYISVIADAPFILKTIFVAAFAAYVSIWHGLMFIYCLDSSGWGKNVVGIAFIGLGIHALDMPFLVNITWFAPWGFLISSILRFIISIGTLMLYVEKNWRDLVTQEQQYRLLAENAADVIYLYRLTPARGFDYISPSIIKLTGYSTDEHYEVPDLLFSLIHPGDRHLTENLAGNPVSFADKPVAFRLIRRDHAVVWVEQTTVPIVNDNGVCTSFEGIIRDISARRDLEQDVSRLDRLHTVGQMAASVAHEIRNPMTTVRGYLQLFLSKQEFSSYREHFHLLLSELDRANLIIREYLSLCQNKSLDLKPHQLNRIVKDLWPLLQADANASSKDVHLSLQTTPDINLDEKEIRQLLLNLVRNGLEAMDPGGAVTIHTYLDRIGQVVLAVQDEGQGIPPHILENLGKPFLTTKEQGTGIGLAVVYRIANDHQASIQVNSNTGGTTFIVSFKPNLS